MNIIRASLYLFVAATLLFGAGVAGKWSGTAEVKLPDGETRTYNLQANFSQSGEDVSGSIGREYEGDGIAIQKGKMQGARLSFEVTPPESMTPVKFKLELKGENLEGSLNGEADGSPLSGRVALARSK